MYFTKMLSYHGFLDMRNKKAICKNQALFDHWFRYLYFRFTSKLKFTLPKEWSLSYVRGTLFRDGFIGIIPSNDFGVIPQECNIYGSNVFGEPCILSVTKPLFNIEYKGNFTPYWDEMDKDLKQDCVLVKCSDDYTGILDVISFWAYNIALLSTSLNMSIINSRFAYAIAAKDEQSSRTIKALLDKVEFGESAVVYKQKLFNNQQDKSENWNFLERSSVRNSYLTDLVLADIEKAISMFDVEVGITDLNDKKERMLNAEVQETKEKSITFIKTIQETIQEGFDKANELFNLELKCEIRGEEDARIYNDSDTGKIQSKSVE